MTAQHPSQQVQGLPFTRGAPVHGKEKRPEGVSGRKRTTSRHPGRASAGIHSVRVTITARGGMCPGASARVIRTPRAADNSDHARANQLYDAHAVLLLDREHAQPDIQQNRQQGRDSPWEPRPGARSTGRDSSLSRIDAGMQVGCIGPSRSWRGESDLNQTSRTHDGIVLMPCHRGRRQPYTRYGDN